MNKELEQNIKIILYEMVEEGELICDCEECDCQLIVTTDF